MLKLTNEEGNKLLAMVGNQVSKNCQQCGSILVLRQNRNNKELFLGCSNYPRCSYTEGVPEEFRMELLGQPKLF